MDHEHAREHGEIAKALETLETAVGKLSNGKSVDLVVKGAVAVLGLLELQSRTGIEVGAAGDAPTAFIKALLSIMGGS